MSFPPKAACSHSFAHWAKWRTEQRILCRSRELWIVEDNCSLTPTSYSRQNRRKRLVLSVAELARPPLAQLDGRNRVRDLFIKAGRHLNGDGFRCCRHRKARRLLPDRS